MIERKIDAGKDPISATQSEAEALEQRLLGALRQIAQMPDKGALVLERLSSSMRILVDLQAYFGPEAEAHFSTDEASAINWLALQGDVAGAQDLAIDIKARAILAQVS